MSEIASAYHQDVEGTDYSSYLKIDDLLQLQVPLSEDAPDELLFIVVHQSYELWFKVVLDELVRAGLALGEARPWLALPHLRRTIVVFDLLADHLAVLETMSPEGFLEFRDPLAPASGFQSFQFRAIEFLCGAGRTEMLEFALFDDDQRAWLREFATRPSIWASFRVSLDEWSDETGADEAALVRSLYHDHASSERSSLHAVAEALIDIDERVMMWRQRHMLMAGRQIGRRTGTGGSAGMSYLATTLSTRFFPVLWDVRSEL